MLASIAATPEVCIFVPRPCQDEGRSSIEALNVELAEKTLFDVLSTERKAPAPAAEATAG